MLEAKSISKVSKILIAMASVLTFWADWMFKLGIDPWHVVVCYSFAYAFVTGTIDMNILVDKFVGGRKDDSARVRGEVERQEG